MADNIQCHIKELKYFYVCFRLGITAVQNIASADNIHIICILVRTSLRRTLLLLNDKCLSYQKK